MKTVFSVAISLIAAVALAKTPKMVIPDRRDFPVKSDVNPCQDFHKYVCENVETGFQLPDNRSMHMFAFSDSSERLLESKKKFMTNILTEKGLPPRSQQIKDYYQACMNTKARIAEEKKVVAENIKKISGIKSIAEMAQLSNRGLENGDGSFLALYPNSNPDDPKVMDLGVAASLLNLPDNKYYDDPALLKDYQDLIASFFKTTGLEKTDKKAQSRASAIVQLEKSAALVYPDSATRRQRYSEKRPMSQAEFLKKYPLFAVDSLFKKIPEKAILSVPIPEGIDSTYKALTEANLDLVKDYFLYSVTDELMDQAYPAFFKKKFEFNKKYFGGPTERPDLQERCTQRTMGTFVKETDQLLMERLFPNFNDEKVRELGAKIRGSIVSGLENNKWLSKEARTEATNKIKKARLFLVRPQNETEWDFIPVKKYSDSQSIANSRLHNQVQFEKSMDSMNKPANLEKWDMGPLTVNAYYSAEENKFVMPMGILQYPFYDEKLSLEENLGAVGTVMGHELGHSIDDQGSKYDSDGRLKQWMSMQDLSEFSKRGGRMADQFDKAGFDGKLTLGENVADNVGLSFSYNAAFPDGKATPEQKKRFFIAYARVWCVVARPQFIDLMKKTNPHAMGYARINEQVKHQPAFSEAFQCKPGDAMSLSDSDRIRIW